MSDRELPPNTPRWVKVFFIIAIVLILLFVIMKITGIGGDHGPGRHFSSYGSSNYFSTVEHKVHLT
ncbi:hypothetical protein [Metabacillus sediminilitoris]|uniref:Uncharacterized protein n=1 Tax=Metabacillus sediminilitoris TaxID=2567941 RepID=A0A4S4BXY3_9BACI|nr:hypothetical protein [Metabacillus sediminilitoris]QGQ44469.1 hypothetical protein GMB29_03865 [Metabacillus sediminilitoris]THF80092.1 hypothetical protein E6W99_10480 [Metabacillus sediminilitoris]